MAIGAPASRRGMARRRALVIGTLVVLLAACSGLVVAWRQGAFESRVSYWLDRGQNCGEIPTGPMVVHVDQSAAERAIACFVTAYAHCRPAVLTQTVPGTDTGDSYTFVVEPRNAGSGCDKGLHRSFYLASGNHTTTDEVQCAGMTSTNGELTISGCQEFGDFTLPLASTG